jgi:hypothetical protein
MPDCVSNVGLLPGWRSPIYTRQMIMITSGKYIVREDGVIYRWSANGWVVCKQSPCNRGYPTVSFNSKTKRVHRIVAELFVPNPFNKKEVNHIDGNKLNNHRKNLEWCTRIDNMQHAWRTGLMRSKGSARSEWALCKYPRDAKPQKPFKRSSIIKKDIKSGRYMDNESIRLIVYLLCLCPNMAEIRRHIPVCKTTLSNIKNGKVYKSEVREILEGIYT